jgi:hypothetical protein
VTGLIGWIRFTLITIAMASTKVAAPLQGIVSSWQRVKNVDFSRAGQFVVIPGIAIGYFKSAVG